MNYQKFFHWLPLLGFIVVAAIIAWFLDYSTILNIGADIRTKSQPINQGISLRTGKPVYNRFTRLTIMLQSFTTGVACLSLDCPPPPKNIAVVEFKKSRSQIKIREILPGGSAIAYGWKFQLTESNQQTGRAKLVIERKATQEEIRVSDEKDRLSSP